MELSQLTQNAMTVLKKRYLQKDPQGNVTETPEELFRRVAKNILKQTGSIIQKSISRPLKTSSIR
jgi:ribonucleotide reductase alpha subunit